MPQQCPQPALFLPPPAPAAAARPLTPARPTSRALPAERADNDLGWLKTFDEYLIGRNNSIQQAGVSWIYQSVIQALARNPDRRFVSVEMGFLMRWLDTQPADVVAEVKSLVAADRLQLCNGGERAPRRPRAAAMRAQPHHPLTPRPHSPPPFRLGDAR